MKQTLRHKRTGTEVSIRFLHGNGEESHQVCIDRRAWLKEMPGSPDWMPSRFTNHRTQTLTPYSRSPLSTTAQTKPIGMLPKLVSRLDVNNQRGWLLVGPAGCSKTTYISAVLTDVHTSRWCDAHDAFPRKERRLSYVERMQTPVPEPKRLLTEQICMWRIKVPDWLVEMHAYDTRNFNGPEVPEPSLTAEKMRSWCSAADTPPILWSEELDKFTATTTRIDYLYRLVDAVYELGGAIIASANMTLPELREHLGRPHLSAHRRYQR